jgi:hypothetical protein
MTSGDMVFLTVSIVPPLLLLALAYVMVRLHERAVDRERARGASTPAE